MKHRRILIVTVVIVLAGVLAWVFGPDRYYRWRLFDSDGRVRESSLVYFHTKGPLAARPALQLALNDYPYAALHEDQMVVYSPHKHTLDWYGLLPPYFIVGGKGGEMHNGQWHMAGNTPFAEFSEGTRVPADWEVRRTYFDAKGVFCIEYWKIGNGETWRASMTQPLLRYFPGDWHQERL